jgi:hypothetical protein
MTSPTPSNHKKTRRRGAAKCHFDQREERLLWRSWWWFGVVFEGVGLIGVDLVMYKVLDTCNSSIFGF